MNVKFARSASSKARKVKKVPRACPWGFHGSYDLSQSLGIPGEVNHPLVIKKMQEVVLKCKIKNVAVGTFADDIKTAKFWISLGVQYMAFSVDVGILYETSKNIVNHLVN